MFYLLFVGLSHAHGIAEGDKGYIQEVTGVQFMSFLYLGTKHMFTGYDHILFLFGVIFFLYKLKDIGLYVSLFAVGHSTTILLGVYIATASVIEDAVPAFIQSTDRIFRGAPCSRSPSTLASSAVAVNAAQIARGARWGEYPWRV